MPILHCPTHDRCNYATYSNFSPSSEVAHIDLFFTVDIHLLLHHMIITITIIVD